MMDEKLGRYRLLKLLATGGMGEVFLARQEGPGGFAKNVVIKRILRHLASDQGFIDLFLNEAKLAAQLQHPNITQVFGLEHEGNTWFISMEFVHGRSLRDVLDALRKKELKFPQRLAARLVSQALQGLHFAHELTNERGERLGVIHRDVTPENLLVSFSGSLKIVDFGIARAMSGQTRVGRPKGKVAYMAPELIVSGGLVDRRADVYAAGVVLYEALALERPPNVPASLDDITKPRLPYAPNPALPPGLNAILAQAMAVKPEDRFASAHDMSDAIEAWLASTNQTVSSQEISAFLTDVFGRETVDTNPAVVALEEGVGRTDVMPAHKGTQPIPVQPRTATQQLRVTAPLTHATPKPTARNRTNLVVALLAGGGTALLVGFITLLAVWPRTKAEAGVADAGFMPPLVEVSPTDRMMPELVLDVPDAGAQAVVSPPKPPVVVKRPPPVVKRPKTGRVELRVNPWAEVFFAGRSYGQTPLKSAIEVPAGTATFTLKNPQLGVTKKVSVKVAAGQSVVLKADLFKK